MFVGIAACDPRGVMGKEGGLPWHCPEDLKHFSDTIQDFPIIMGRRTYSTLPARYLERRKAIIFSRQKSLPNFVSSLDEVDESFAYVIGGAEIYTLFLREKRIAKFILTKMKHCYEGDVFFPLELLHGWRERKILETELFWIYEYHSV